MKLKKYDEYFKKLKDYSSLCRLNICFVKAKDADSYSSSQRKIIISEDQDQSETIVALLHEIGHFIDDHRNPINNISNKFMTQARVNIENSNTLTMRQKRKIIKNERVAWKNARGLARQLGIPLGQWFFKAEKKYLKTYSNLKIREY